MTAAPAPVLVEYLLRFYWYFAAWLIWQRGRKRVRALANELSNDATPPAVFVKTASVLAITIVTAMLGFLSAWCWLLTALSVIALVGTYREESRLAQVLSERYKRTRTRLRCGSLHVVVEAGA